MDKNGSRLLDVNTKNAENRMAVERVTLYSTWNLHTLTIDIFTQIKIRGYVEGYRFKPKLI